MGMRNLFQGPQTKIVFLALGLIILVGIGIPGLVDYFSGPTGQAATFSTPFQTTTPTQALVQTTPDPSPTPSPAEVQVRSALTPTSWKNCTLALSYWESHPTSWPIEEFRIGDLNFEKSSALAIIQSDSQEVSGAILSQVFIYMLNIFRGSDPSTIMTSVSEANLWLNSNFNRSNLSAVDIQKGLEIASQLNAYNTGLTGPGPCPAMTETLTPTLTQTPTQTPTFTPTPTKTSTITPIPPSPTREQWKRRFTRTPVPTHPPPPPPAAPPTQEPPPKPTSVPTQPPPPTSAPTDPPPTSATD